MNSIGDNCKELKKQYDDCFNIWFTEKFLKGDTNEDMCTPLFKIYQECVRGAIKNNNIDLQEVDKKVLGTDKEQQRPPKSS